MNDYNKLEEPTDEENDMLDLAFGLTETLVKTPLWIFFSLVISVLCEQEVKIFYFHLGGIVRICSVFDNIGC